MKKKGGKRAPFELFEVGGFIKVVVRGPHSLNSDFGEKGVSSGPWVGKLKHLLEIKYTFQRVQEQCISRLLEKTQLLRK